MLVSIAVTKTILLITFTTTSTSQKNRISWKCSIFSVASFKKLHFQIIRVALQKHIRFGRPNDLWSDAVGAVCFKETPNVWKLGPTLEAGLRMALTQAQPRGEGVSGFP